MLRPVSDAFMGHLSNVPTALDHSGVSDVVTAPVVKIGYLGHQFDPYDRFLTDYSIQIVTTPTTLPVNNSELPYSPTSSDAAGFKPDSAGELDEALRASYKSTQNLLDPDHFLETPLIPLDDNTHCLGQNNCENGSDSAEDTMDLSSAKKTLQMPPAIMDNNTNAVVESKPVRQTRSSTRLKFKKPTVAKAKKSKAMKPQVKGIEINNQYYSVNKITGMKTERFNNIIEGESNKEIAQLAKKIRVRGRNTICARNSRKRKSDEIGILEFHVDLLKPAKKWLKSRNEKISIELKHLNKDIKALQKKLVKIYGSTPYLKTL
ncbi:hypothetical protein [Endozoicomonas sp. ALE010]|uniref:hypothetical protein n=1 Tax=Endozoicomonas sp. ALE010 TaxID=3403081 RepID=UPI003BB66F97